MLLHIATASCRTPEVVTLVFIFSFSVPTSPKGFSTVPIHFGQHRSLPTFAANGIGNRGFVLVVQRLPLPCRRCGGTWNIQPPIEQDKFRAVCEPVYPVPVLHGFVSQVRVRVRWRLTVLPP